MKNIDLQAQLELLPMDAEILISVNLADVFTLPASEVGYRPEENKVVIWHTKEI